MSLRWVNGTLVDTEPNRACLYGDGVFETMSVRAGRIVFLPYHWRRLQRGLSRLGFSTLSEQGWQAALGPALDSVDDALLRVTVTREGVRGYAYQVDASLIIDVQKFPLPSKVWHGSTVKARWCQTTWAQQPLLAGIKHLNRLEQVLARSEWSDTSIAEGLVCDTQGNLISGTMSAVLVRVGNRVFASDLRQTGIDSVARQVVMAALPELGYELMVKTLSKQEVLIADEILLMNVIQGICGLAECDGNYYDQPQLLHQLAPLWLRWQLADSGC